MANLSSAESFGTAGGRSIEAARNYFAHHKTDGLQTVADAYLPQMNRYEGERVRDMLSEAGYQFTDRPDGGIDVKVQGTSCLGKWL